MSRTRIDLLPYTAITHASGSWYQDVKYAVPVGQNVRAVVIATVKVAPSADTTLYLYSAPDKTWADAEWTARGGSGLITSASAFTGGLIWVSDGLGDWIRFGSKGNGASTITLGGVVVYLETEA